jgi:hypothetical protein
LRKASGRFFEKKLRKKPLLAYLRVIAAKADMVAAVLAI